MEKVNQKMQFPIILLVGDSDLSKNLVRATRGSCNNMPRKATPVIPPESVAAVQMRRYWDGIRTDDFMRGDPDSQLM